jgi:anti-anti-sigma factor
VEFRVDLQPDGDRLTLRVHGEVDDFSGRDLSALVDDIIRDHDERTLVFDLAGVVFMDSRGLGEFLHACRSIERVGRSVHVANPSIHAQRVLDSAGLSDRFREP